MKDGPASGRAASQPVDPVPRRRERGRRWLIGGGVAAATSVSGALLLCPVAGACGACGACAPLIPIGVAAAVVGKAVLPGLVRRGPAEDAEDARPARGGTEA